MHTAQAEVSLSLRTDERLLELLRSEGDRLSVDAVNELVARGARMIGPLSDICRNEASWKGEGEASWLPVHAVYLLGAIGGEAALPPLLDALRESTRHDESRVWKKLPAVLGSLGRPAVAPLKQRVRDRRLPVRERTVAVHCLAGLAARTPIEQGDILDFLRTVVENEEQTGWIRGVAAFVLLRFVRPGDRKLVLAAAAQRTWTARAPLFTMQEVRETYGRRVPETGAYLDDWMDFYGAEAQEKRERLRREKAEDAEWRQGAETGEPWVQRVQGQLLGKYEGSLTDLGSDAAGDALWVAESMVEYLVLHERVAPWRWNGATAHAFLMDCFVRWVSLDDPGRIAMVPDNLLRFVRYCESEGRISREAREEAESVVRREREELVTASMDPERRCHARRMIEKLLLKGIDPADPAAFVSLLDAKKAGPLTRTYPRKDSRSA